MSQLGLGSLIRWLLLIMVLETLLRIINGEFRANLRKESTYPLWPAREHDKQVQAIKASLNSWGEQSKASMIFIIVSCTEIKARETENAIALTLPGISSRKHFSQYRFKNNKCTAEKSSGRAHHYYYGSWRQKKLSPILPHICKTVGVHRAKYLLFTRHVSNAKPPDTIGSPKEGQGCLTQRPHHTSKLPVVTMEHSSLTQSAQESWRHS